jgi:drug/metabolite transporter (DMT)-like permease
LALSIFVAAGEGFTSSGLSTVVILSLLGSAAMAMFADASFVRALAVEDVSRVFTVSTSLYILISVIGSVLFAQEPFSVLVVLAGIAVLVGARLVIQPPQDQSRIGGRRHDPAFALWLSVVAAVLWSASLLVVAEAMESVEALTATAIRLPFMALALLSIAAVRSDFREGLNARDARILAMSGVLVVGAMMLFLLSAKMSSAGTVAVLTSTSPIFVAPLAHFFLNERLTPRIATGTLTCMLGIWLASV